MKCKKIAASALFALMLTPMAFAQKGGLPKGQPFQILQNNDVVMMELIDQLILQIDELSLSNAVLHEEVLELSARVAALEEAGEKEPPKDPTKPKDPIPKDPKTPKDDPKNPKVP